jgi:transposase
VEYVGIDVHKGECQVCVVDDEGTIQREFRFRTTTAELTRRLERYAGSRVLIEASTESEWVARCLESLKLEVIVANPNYALMYAARKQKVKTDRADALALAQACRLKLYKPAHRMTDEQRRTRKQLGARALLVRHRSKTVNFVRAYLRSLGTPAPSCEVEQFVIKVRGLELPEEERVLVERLLTALEALQKQIDAFDEKIEELSENDDRVQRLTTVPGVGCITAAAFVALLWDVDRFQRAHQVEAYLGLVPGERSSGSKERKGRITKTGDSYVRALLVQCAHTILRRRNAANAGLYDWAKQIQERSSKQVAVVALARKLAGILFAMWRDEKEFDSTKQPRRSEEKAAA